MSRLLRKKRDKIYLFRFKKILNQPIGEVEVWEVGGAAEPVVVGIDLGEGYYLAAFEGGEAVVELGFASSGELEVLGH